MSRRAAGAIRIAVWLVVVIGAAIGLELLGHKLGRGSSAELILSLVVAGLVLGGLASLTGVSGLLAKIMLMAGGAGAFLWVFGAGAMDDPIFCPTAPASECIGFAVGGLLALPATAVIFGIGFFLAGWLRQGRA